GGVRYLPAGHDERLEGVAAGSAADAGLVRGLVQLAQGKALQGVAESGQDAEGVDARVDPTAGEALAGRRKVGGVGVGEPGLDFPYGSEIVGADHLLTPEHFGGVRHVEGDLDPVGQELGRFGQVVGGGLLHQDGGLREEFARLVAEGAVGGGGCGYDDQRGGFSDLMKGGGYGQVEATESDRLRW